MELINEPAHTYHQRHALTSHKLIDFAASPRLYEQRHVLKAWPRASSPAFGLGTLVHLLLLEPHRASEIRTDAPINEKTGKPYGADTAKAADWRAEVEAKGQLAVSESELATARTMVSHALEVAAICHVPLGIDGPKDGCLTEQTILGHDDRVGTIQCRPDLWARESGCVWDVKTTSNLPGFRYSMRDYNYAMQAAWYIDLIKRLDGMPPIWRWLVIESVAPYRVKIFSAANLITEAQAKLPGLLDRMQQCHDTNAWPLSLEGYEASLDQ